MSSSIPSTPRRYSQSETETATSSPGIPSSNGQDGIPGVDSEKSAQKPVMTTRQDENTPANSKKDADVGVEPSKGILTSSSPTVINRPTTEERRAQYRQNRHLNDPQNDKIVKKIKTEKQGGAAGIQHAPEHNAEFEEFSSAVRDGKLYSNSVRLKHVMRDLAEWLRTSPDCLRELFLLVVEESSADFAVLAQALGSNTTLNSLHICCGRVDGAVAMADALQRNSTLKKLDLNRNDIGDDGAEVLLGSLKFNRTLTTLDLSDNRISITGAAALAEVLRFNRTLKEINFSINFISDDGAQMLLDALQVNTTLTELGLEHCGINFKIKEKIRSLLNRNRRLELQPYAEASLDLLVRRSPALEGMDALTDVLPLIAEQLSDDVLEIFRQEWEDAFRAPSATVTTTTTNATVTTTTTTTSDSTIPTEPFNPSAAPVADTTSATSSLAEPTAAEITELLADPNPVAALSRWIGKHTNPQVALNWVDPANGYTLLHYAVITQQGAVIRDLMRRGIDRQKTDHSNQTAAQLAQALADSSSSQVVANIAALFR